MVGGTQLERQQLQNLLRQLRKDVGLRQVDLAVRLDKPQSYVSKYESGEKSLDLFEIREVCNALNITLLEFVENLENKNETKS